MIFTRLAISALSIGAVFAAPTNVADSKAIDVTVPVGVLPVAPRALGIREALDLTLSAAQLIKGDLVPVPVDETKVIQLSSEMADLGGCVNTVNTVLSKAIGVSPGVNIAPTLKTLKEVGEKLQSSRV